MTGTAIRSARRQRPQPGQITGPYRKLYGAQVMDRIVMITEGVLAIEARQWLDMPVLGRNITYQALDLPVATFNKKVKANGKLSPAESERVIGNSTYL